LGLAVLFVSATSVTPAASAAEKTLYAFPSTRDNGCYPAGTLLGDAAGALYGAANLCGAAYSGTLFKLAPPGLGQTKWVFERLYVFDGYGDGERPSADLVMDASSAIYGTTQSGGFMFQGTVFKLTPPTDGSTPWKKTVLHYFQDIYGNANRDGSNPGAGLTWDADGALYGTTNLGGGGSVAGYGTVFKLAPPVLGKTDWRETVLYRFAGGADGRNPFAVLAMDGAGALYGTTLYGGRGTCVDPMLNTVGCGTVFKLAPPPPGATAWRKTTLHRFAGGADGGIPQGKLFRDASGALYGATYQGGSGKCAQIVLQTIIGCGTVFKLTPPAAGETGWTYSVLYSFEGLADGAYPQGGVIRAAAGSLYGTASAGGAYGNGVAFKLSPPVPPRYQWTEMVLYNFNISTSGDTPVGELVGDADGQLFGVAWGGGPSLLGTVFKITP
jgi:uncharacterized repeat protein (TIGR03803 family)